VAERLRTVARAIAAVFLTLISFAVFLAMRGVDISLSAIRGDSSHALAPLVVTAWARVALSLLGLKVRATGSPLCGPGALVANHASWIDVVVLQATSRAAFVSKAEVAGWPVIGLIGKAIGTMFIERRPTEAGRQNAALKSRLKHGDLLCLFPETTSTDGQRVLAFNSSLFSVFMEPDLHPEIRIQPVTLRYRPKAGLPKTLYAWWGEMAFGPHLGHVLAVSTGGVVDVVFHESLRPAHFADRKALASQARSVVAEGFQKLEGVSSEPP
jgi:1-acyl-sn-glycerol-3-phosphate acyltransferase